MDKIIIFGTTKHSEMLREIIEQEQNAIVCAHTIHRKYITKKLTSEFERKNYPLIAFEDIDKYYSPLKYKILNTIGYSKMNSIRQLVGLECDEKGYKRYTFISSNASIYSKINVDSGNIVMPGAYIGTNVKLGINNVLYSGSVLTHDIELDNNIFIGAGSIVGGNVTIGSNTFLGLNSTIKNNVHLAKNTLVGAAAYINTDTDQNGVYVPCRSIKINKNSNELI